MKFKSGWRGKWLVPAIVLLMFAFASANAQVSTHPSEMETLGELSTTVASQDQDAASTEPVTANQPGEKAPWVKSVSGEASEGSAVVEQEESSVAENPDPVTAPSVAQSAESPDPVVAPSVAQSASETSETPKDGETAKEEGAKSIIDWDRINVLVIVLILASFITYFTYSAKQGKNLFIRRIGGLAAIDDAVGRATEMGRGVLYIPGIYDMDDIQTIAGVTILGHVAKKTAEYDTALYAPMARSFTMSVSQEVVKQSYLEKGRSDAFRPDRINYLTDDQFGFVAGVGGIMMRERPAACFYLGTFYAESLILAETGNSVGAIQIAGTAEPSQIPFFVAACDYTLIGEELFAASAYLSKNPQEVGSLKGQDMSKLVIIVFILVITLMTSISTAKLLPDDSSLKTFLESVLNKVPRGGN